MSLLRQAARLLVCLSFVLCGLLLRAEEIGLPDVDPQADGVVDLLKEGLKAWEAEDGRPVDNWRLASGVLTNFKAGSHLITVDRYRDFDLHLEFSLPKEGNSGVYLRGRYEVQLYDGPIRQANLTTGAIWNQIPVEAWMYKGTKTWNELDVRLVGQSVTVLVNRKPVIRSQSLLGPTKGAIDREEDQPGPILLQSLRGVRFRNIRIRPLPSDGRTK